MVLGNIWQDIPLNETRKSPIQPHPAPSCPFIWVAQIESSECQPERVLSSWKGHRRDVREHEATCFRVITCHLTNPNMIFGWKVSFPSCPALAPKLPPTLMTWKGVTLVHKKDELKAQQLSQKPSSKANEKGLIIHNFKIQISKRNKKKHWNTKKNINKTYEKNVAKVSRYFTNLPYQPCQLLIQRSASWTPLGLQCWFSNVLQYVTKGPPGDISPETRMVLVQSQESQP